MTSIRLRYKFSFDHCEIPAGTVITVPAGLARELVARQAADLVEPERAIVQPEETRELNESAPVENRLRRRK
jgi:hypothetical protein